MIIIIIHGFQSCMPKRAYHTSREDWTCYNYAPRVVFFFFFSISCTCWWWPIGTLSLVWIFYALHLDKNKRQTYTIQYKGWVHWHTHMHPNHPPPPPPPALAGDIIDIHNIYHDNNYYTWFPLTEFCIQLIGCRWTSCGCTRSRWIQSTSFTGRGTWTIYSYYTTQWEWC